ncbi:MAG: hypothetical protein WCL51_13005 [Bacteroidota bacterium]
MKKIISILVLTILTSIILISCGGGRDVNSKLIGTWSGNWQGDIIGEINSGNATMEIKSNGDAVLNLSSSKLGEVKHTGYINKDNFVITSSSDGEKVCPIVSQSKGFKLVLIWKRMNMDVYLK